MFGTKIIKIPGKSFDDLDAEEVALMIEADSAISRNGNKFFSPAALDEFLYSTMIKRKDLLELRAYILQRIYVEKEGVTAKDIDIDFLLDTARRIREGIIPISSKSSV